MNSPIAAGTAAALVVVGLLAGCATEAEVQQLSDEDLAANQELDRQFVEAMSQKDVEKVMSLFWNSPHFVLVTPEGTVHLGWENARKALQEMFAGLESVRLEINEVTHVRSGDCVLAVGTATYQMEPRDGPPQQFTERWTDVRRKIGGRWVYVLDHAHALPASTP